MNKRDYFQFVLYHKSIPAKKKNKNKYNLSKHAPGNIRVRHVCSDREYG